MYNKIIISFIFSIITARIRMLLDLILRIFFSFLLTSFLCFGLP